MHIVDPPHKIRDRTVDPPQEIRDRVQASKELARENSLPFKGLSHRRVDPLTGDWTGFRSLL